VVEEGEGSYKGPIAEPHKPFLLGRWPPHVVRTCTDAKAARARAQYARTREKCQRHCSAVRINRSHLALSRPPAAKTPAAHVRAAFVAKLRQRSGAPRLRRSAPSAVVVLTGRTAAVKRPHATGCPLQPLHGRAPPDELQNVGARALRG